MIVLSNESVIGTTHLVVDDLVRVLGSVTEGDSLSYIGKVRPKGFTSSNRLVTTANGLVVEVLPPTESATLIAVVECIPTNPRVTQVLGTSTSAVYETMDGLIKLRVDVPVGFVCVGLVEEGSVTEYQYRVVLDRTLDRTVTHVVLVNTVTGVAVDIDGSHKQFRVVFVKQTVSKVYG